MINYMISTLENNAIINTSIQLGHWITTLKRAIKK